MKQIDFPRIFMACLLGVAVFSFASCDDDDPDVPANNLKLSATSVQVAPKQDVTVTIGAGTAPYTVTSSNEKVATGSVSDKTITVTGVADGSAILKVADKSGLASQIVVAVKEVMTVDKSSVEVATGKTAEVSIKNGTAPYTVTSKDGNIATASVNNDKVTIKGVKAGSTSVTITDKNKSSATVSVVVK